MCRNGSYKSFYLVVGALLGLSQLSGEAESDSLPSLFGEGRIGVVEQTGPRPVVRVYDLLDDNDNTYDVVSTENTKITTRVQGQCEDDEAISPAGWVWVEGFSEEWGNGYFTFQAEPWHQIPAIEVKLPVKKFAIPPPLPNHVNNHLLSLCNALSDEEKATGKLRQALLGELRYGTTCDDEPGAGYDTGSGYSWVEFGSSGSADVKASASLVIDLQCDPIVTAVTQPDSQNWMPDLISAQLFNSDPVNLSGSCPQESSVSALVYGTSQGSFQARIESQSGWNSTWKTYQLNNYDASLAQWYGLVDIPFQFPEPGGISGTTNSDGGAQIFDQSGDLTVGDTPGVEDQVGGQSGGSGQGVNHGVGQVSVTHTNDLIHNSLIRIAAKANGTAVETPFRSFTIACDPEKSDTAQAAASDYALEHNVIAANIEVLPRPEQCGVEVKGQIETDFNNVNVTFALELANGNMSSSRTIQTSQTSHGYRAQFSEFFDMSSSGEGVWASQGENGVQIGNSSNAPDFTRQGSFKIVTTAPNVYESSTGEFDFSCLVINDMTFAPKTGEVNPDVMQMSNVASNTQAGDNEPGIAGVTVFSDLNTTTDSEALQFGAKVQNKAAQRTSVNEQSGPDANLGTNQVNNARVSEPTRTSIQAAGSDNTNQLSGSHRLIILSPKGTVNKENNRIRISGFSDAKGYRVNWRCSKKSAASKKNCNDRGLPRKITSRNETFAFSKSVGKSHWLVKICSVSKPEICDSQSFQYTPATSSVSGLSGLNGETDLSNGSGVQRTSSGQDQGADSDRVKTVKVDQKADGYFRSARKDRSNNTLQIVVGNKGEGEAKACRVTVKSKSFSGKKLKTRPSNIQPGRAKTISLSLNNTDLIEKRLTLLLECANDSNKSNNRKVVN